MSVMQDTDGNPIVDLCSAETLTAQQQERSRQIEGWQRENAKAIDAYNRLVEQQGVFGDALRKF